MRYARRLVQLLEADLARDRARIVELNATIDALETERDQLAAKCDELIAERDEHPSHFAAYMGGRREVLKAMRKAVNDIEVARNGGFALVTDTAVYRPEDIIPYITQVLDAEEEQTE